MDAIFLLISELDGLCSGVKNDVLILAKIARLKFIFNRGKPPPPVFCQLPPVSNQIHLFI
jgi:hypothetical protein